MCFHRLRNRQTYKTYDIGTMFGYLGQKWWYTISQLSIAKFTLLGDLIQYQLCRWKEIPPPLLVCERYLSANDYIQQYGEIYNGPNQVKTVLSLEEYDLRWVGCNSESSLTIRMNPQRTGTRRETRQTRPGSAKNDLLDWRNGDQLSQNFPRGFWRNTIQSRNWLFSTPYWLEPTKQYLNKISTVTDGRIYNLPSSSSPRISGKPFRWA